MPVLSIWFRSRRKYFRFVLCAKDLSRIFLLRSGFTTTLSLSARFASNSRCLVRASKSCPLFHGSDRAFVGTDSPLSGPRGHYSLPVPRKTPFAFEAIAMCQIRFACPLEALHCAASCSIEALQSSRSPLQGRSQPPLGRTFLSCCGNPKFFPYRG